MVCIRLFLFLALSALIIFSSSCAAWNDTSKTWTDLYHDFEDKQKYGTFEAGEESGFFDSLFTPRKSSGITAGEGSSRSSNSDPYRSTGLQDVGDQKYKSRYGSF